ncbi:hypothetical protein OXPF_09870 [Oxobacter pfennigii]|uniref:Uncharacterized protein n=1 Tax=Oxobacter pfennigii TaxID=36849 RepID=A0A0P8WAU4_9CLOT|nr:hypothetical protein [Oxobacter pfennigii]KPU45753.1 hypothetical protein OXPF_09870 [Oxobacter pfennigii]
MKNFLFIIIPIIIAFSIGRTIIIGNQSPITSIEDTAPPVHEAKDLTEATRFVFQNKELTEMDFFSNITEQIRKDWEADAKMYSIYADIPGSKVKDLLNLSYNYNWSAAYISPSRKRKIEVSLYDKSISGGAGADIIYTYKNTTTGHIGRAKIEAVKDNINYKIEETDIVNDYSYYTFPEEWFYGWQKTFKDIGSMIYNELQGDIKNTDSFTLKLYTINKEKPLPVWEANWKSKNNKQNKLLIDAVSGNILDNNI